MKPLIYRRFSMLLVTAIVSANSLVAQSTDYIAMYNVKNPIPEMAYNVNGAEPVISSKILSAFSGLFKNATDARWFEVEDKFLVKFSQNGRSTRALYDKKGALVYSIAEGNEKSLPADLRRMVKANYIDFDITHAFEVNTLGKTAWIVKLQDDTYMVAVKIVDGEMEETENYRISK